MIEVKMTFQNLAELQDFLNDNPAHRDAPVAIKQPAPAPAAAVVAPIAAPAPEPQVPDLPSMPAVEAPAPKPEPAPKPTPEAPVDPKDDSQLQRIQNHLAAAGKAAGSPEPIREFLATFGCQRLSEIPASQLDKVEAAMQEQFPS